MSHGLNIMTTVTEKINRIFRSMFEFKLSQAAQTKLKLSKNLIPLALWQLYMKLVANLMN